MNPEEIKELYSQYFYYILAADILIGLVFGLVPLIFGLRRKKRNLGFTGFLLSGLVGAFSPLLSIVVAAVFVFLVMRNAAKTASNTNSSGFSSEESDNSTS
jgi:hypothetical protein